MTIGLLNDDPNLEQGENVRIKEYMQYAAAKKEVESVILSLTKETFFDRGNILFFSSKGHKNRKY
ncbi:MAG: hypothetical protein ACPG5B_17295, partial [Chitinophagales bacterium]